MVTPKRDQLQTTIKRNNSQFASCEDLFAERFSKVSFRSYANNTRLDIKNVDLKN